MTQADLHIRMLVGTYHLLSARRLKLMKPTAYIVNTARGEVIDENTLARMLEAGQLSAYDASYLWLAKYLGLELITLDEKLEKAAALV